MFASGETGGRIEILFVIITIGELWEAEPPERSTVWTPVCIGLGHQVRMLVERVKSNFHLPDCLKVYPGIKQAVSSHNICTSFGHSKQLHSLHKLWRHITLPDCALSNRDSVPVSLGPYSHGSSYRLAIGLAQFYGPLHLLVVAGYTNINLVDN